MSTPRPRRHAVAATVSAAMAAAAAVTLTACSAGGGHTPSAHAENAPPTRTASPTPKPPEEICTDIVGHWAVQELRGNSGYGDYQSRGLSDSQNNVLLDVVAEAKAERKKHGEQAALEFAAREAESRCRELHENGGPTSSANGWPE